MAQDDPLEELNYMFNVDCEEAMIRLTPGHNYFPQIQHYLIEEGYWPPDLDELIDQTILNVIECMRDLNAQFESLNTYCNHIQDLPQWRDLWIRLDQFVGEEVNEQNRVMAMFIRELYRSPIVKGIEDTVTEHYEEINVFTADYMITILTDNLLVNELTEFAQREVYSIMFISDLLLKILSRAREIASDYDQFMGIEAIEEEEEEEPLPPPPPPQVPRGHRRRAGA